MTPGLLARIIAVTLVLVFVVVREYRLQQRPEVTRAMFVLHAGRMLAWLMIGFGAIGLLVHAAGFWVPPSQAETEQVTPMSGIQFTEYGFEHRQTLLIRASRTSIVFGLLLLVGCTATLWSNEKRPSGRSGAG
jgi:hypothetical protein